MGLFGVYGGRLLGGFGEYGEPVGEYERPLGVGLYSEYIGLRGCKCAGCDSEWLGSNVKYLGSRLARLAGLAGSEGSACARSDGWASTTSAITAVTAVTSVMGAMALALTGTPVVPFEFASSLKRQDSGLRLRFAPTMSWLGESTSSPNTTKVLTCAYVVVFGDKAVALEAVALKTVALEAVALGVVALDAVALKAGAFDVVVLGATVIRIGSRTRALEDPSPTICDSTNVETQR